MDSQLTPVAQFSIKCYQYLDPAGQPVTTLPDFAQNIAHLQDCYRQMVLTRTFDQKAIALQRTGKLGTYAASLGQEAVAIGIGHALQTSDVFCTSYRDYGTQFLRGVQMEEILSYWGGSERGNVYQSPVAKEDLPICIPIGSQCLHAAGIAAAMKLRQQARAVVVTCGDGATSQGDFYEAVNIAGAWHLPLVIVIVNNEWAISLPRHAQTAAQTLAQKAIAGGIAGEQADGNDVIAMQARVSAALEKARAGKGATVIEALTYRLSDHTTADDASRYRSKEELAEAWQKEPLIRLRQYLISQQAWSETQEQEWQQSCAQQVEAAIQRYHALPPEPPAAMFAHHYANLPESLLQQQHDFLAQ